MHIEWQNEINRVSARIERLRREQAPEEKITKAEGYLKEIEELKAYHEEALEMERQTMEARKPKLTNDQLKYAAIMVLLRLFEAKVRVKRREVTAILKEQTDELEQLKTMQIITALQQAENQIKARIQDEQKKKPK